MRLRAKTLLPVAVLAASCLVFLYAYWFPRSLLNLEEQELRATERHLESVAAALVPLLLAHQLDAVYENLDALLAQNQEWVAITLVDPDGKSLYPLREGAPTPARRLWTITRPVQVRGHDLGRLVLDIDLSRLTAAAEHRHRELATVLIIVFCGCFFGIAFVLERVVRRPVGILAHAAERVAEGDFGAPLIRTGDDEVGSLVASFARMRSSILDYQTRQRESAEAIKRLSQELERRVAERTLQLEVANKELEAFAYSTSHDLRAPLRHVIGFCELLKKHAAEPDEQTQHYLAAISGAALRMDRLIEDLLSFSRMGRRELTGVEVDLARVVHDVRHELEPECQGRVIQWHVDGLPKVHADSTMLHIALVNLVSNALKFTRPRASAEIVIGAERGEAETVVFVRDNGVGFDPRYVHKLFGVFQRLHAIEEFEGTGIGLANVRRIIARHGGRTWAEGRLGEGATFYFSLPNREADAIGTAGEPLQANLRTSASR